MSSPWFSKLEAAIFTSTVLAALTMIPVCAAAQPAGRVEVYAHRGARAFSPENTLPAFRTAIRIGADWVDMDVVLTKKSLDEAHRLGLKVVVWSWPEKLGTAFDATLTARMIDWGVDGIITDDPGRLSSMLAARGFHVPNRY